MAFGPEFQPTASAKNRFILFADQAGVELWRVSTDPDHAFPIDAQVEHAGTTYKVEKTLLTVESDEYSLKIFLSVVP